ncbi:hypothetical protein B0G80_8721 [Paraburkholderia sp. BL6669N2]|uniref:hypothetical protein n=1 Tax=Paraburkholderia sp. BL6669N2 TaxID=1938807 RepID=UPI000E3B1568|nr:hypothetical protein [Paraburkholderia sp. BL6669N2]REG52188.1 hypothetical protein B0G80_8721 [Paraburkholderia sp. BL6669N2]
MANSTVAKVREKTLKQAGINGTCGANADTCNRVRGVPSLVDVYQSTCDPVYVRESRTGVTEFTMRASPSGWFIGSCLRQWAGGETS